MPALTWERTPVAGREFLFEELPPRQGPWAAAWSRDSWGGQDGDYVCLYTANLIRKYGAEAWEERATQQALTRTRAWAFCGGGKWGSPAGLVATPVLHRGGVPVLAGHPDVFDPEVCRVFRERVAEQIALICHGYEDANDCDRLRDDAAFRAAAECVPGSPALASQPTMTRFENHVGRRELIGLFCVFLDAFLDSYAKAPECMIIDMDPTVNRVYGDQQMALFNAHCDEYCLMPLHVYEGITGRG